MQISVVINTLNEESNIAACIQSVSGLAEEILVCDMQSNDDTVRIAKNCGARVLSHERTGFVEPARHFAISQASGEWVLVLDADERLCSPLKEKLLEAVSDNSCNVVCFWSLYWFFGGWVYHGGFFNGNWSRFFRKSAYLDTYSSQEEFVHGNFRNVRRSGKVLRLPRTCYIEHYAYPTIEKYITKTLGIYARIEAGQILDAGRKFSLLRMLWEPLKECAGRFVIRQGFRDGMRGFVLASLYAGFRFVVWANVWFLGIEREKKSRAQER
jgi:glycosyltransferase involved in cell wall biosynthesis